MTILNDSTSQSTFGYLFRRLDMLERWRELAIRPEKQEEWPDDSDLFENDVDDCRELTRRCLEVRTLMNENLPLVEQVMDDVLVSKESSIPNAGLGLFYEPLRPDPVPSGKIICFYAGHIHDFHSAKTLKDKSYLMLVQGGVLVDAGPLTHFKARYINDPLNDLFVNSKFVPDGLRSAVVSTREILPGEEIYAAYGDGYWAQHATLGRAKV